MSANHSTLMNFRNYSIFSAVTAFAMIAHSYQKQDGNFFNTVVYLTSQKVNLLVFLNFFLVTLLQMGNILVWVFFDSIRTIELKYILDKSQKKIFHFLLVIIVLRSTLDFYKLLSLAVLFLFWIVHWLTYKRSDYLISRGSRGVKEHLRLMILYSLLIVVDFSVAHAFYERFQVAGEKINEIFVFIGFEFVRLLLKAIQDNFKYTISLIELYYREQWTEKGFVFNIVSFVFDTIALLLNVKLFTYILSRQQFPIYLLSEIIDTFVRLGQSIQLFIQSRQLINKLKRLPDVDAEKDQLQGIDNTCIICLEEIKQAKKLKCGHIFHLNCLRRWLETNVQCPTCRDKIELDAVAANQVHRERDQRRHDQAARRRLVRLARRLDIPVPPAVGQEEVKTPELPPNQEAIRSSEAKQDVDGKIMKEASEMQNIKAQQSPERDAEQLARQRELRLSRFRSAQPNSFKPLSTDQLREADRILTDILQTNELVEESKDIEKKDPHLFDVEETKIPEGKPSNTNIILQDEELKEEENQIFKDIFQVNEEDLLDLFEAQEHKDEDSHDNELFGIEEEEAKEPLAAGASSDEEETEHLKDLLADLALDKKAFKKEKKSAESNVVMTQPVLNTFDIRFGSVPFGLPCIAQTRRTLDITLRNKQIERINEKLSRVMREPANYVKLD